MQDGGGPPGLAFGADSAPAPAIVFWGRAFARAVLLVRGQLGSQAARITGHADTSKASTSSFARLLPELQPRLPAYS